MRWSPAAVLLVLLASGCLSSSDDAEGGGRNVAAPPWTMECYGAEDWDDPCTSLATRMNGPANENWLAVNPTDPMNVVVMGKDYNPRASDCVWMGVQVTKDGGKTWKESYLGGDLSQRAPTDASFAYTCNTDPMFTFDEGGVLYASFEVYSRLPNQLPLPPPNDHNPVQGGQNTLYIAVSRDGGETFSGFVPVWIGDGFAILQDRTMIVANPESGSIHFAWSQREAAGTFGRIMVSTSRDSGESWSLPTIVSDNADLRLNIPVAIAAAPDGTLYVGWYSLAGPVGEATNHIELSVSSDDGRTFSEPRQVQDIAMTGLVEFAPNTEFYVAVDLMMAVVPAGARAGDLHMVYNDKVGGHLEVMTSRSSDRGATWSEPAAVAGPGADDNARFHGAIVADDEGGIHVTYFDRQYDPGDRLLDITWAYAADGETFTHRRITASSFDGDIGYHQSGVPFIGDYNGLGVVGDHLYASFPDTRMGRSDLAVAHFVRD